MLNSGTVSRPWRRASPRAALPVPRQLFPHYGNLRCRAAGLRSVCHNDSTMHMRFTRPGSVSQEHGRHLYAHDEPYLQRIEMQHLVHIDGQERLEEGCEGFAV